MRSTQQLSITLPNEMAEAIRAKVAAGEYATESEVIRDGLRVLLARDQAVESWLRKDVAAAHDALNADPTRAVSSQAVRARLWKQHGYDVDAKDVVIPIAQPFPSSLPLGWTHDCEMAPGVQAPPTPPATPASAAGS